MKDHPVKSGDTFGRLTVKSAAMKDNAYRLIWICLCECGKAVNVRYDHLTSGKIASCGCLRAEVGKQNGHKSATHGDCRRTQDGKRKTPEYRAWSNMLSRCYNRHDISYPNYGGRGVTVCTQWRDSFASFLHDVGRRPTVHHSLDRFPGQDGNYEPGNVRWATPTEQQRNIRSNKLITLNGETRCIAEWAEITGINDGTIRARLRAGWPVERLFEGGSHV